MKKSFYDKNGFFFSYIIRKKHDFFWKKTIFCHKTIFHFFPYNTPLIHSILIFEIFSKTGKMGIFWYYNQPQNAYVYFLAWLFAFACLHSRLSLHYFVACLFTFHCLPFLCLSLPTCVPFLTCLVPILNCPLPALVPFLNCLCTFPLSLPTFVPFLAYFLRGLQSYCIGATSCTSLQSLSSEWYYSTAL